MKACRGTFQVLLSLKRSSAIMWLLWIGCVFDASTKLSFEPLSFTVAYYMEGRDSAQLLYRWTKRVDPRIRRGAWTPKEDAVRPISCCSWGRSGRGSLFFCGG